LTAAKVGALGALCLAALCAPRAAVWAREPLEPSALLAGGGALVAALVALLWTYDGWSDVTLVAGEIRDPGRNLGRAVLYGTAILVVLYATVQVAVGTLLPNELAARSERVVAEAVAVGLGAGTGRIVSILVLVCTFGSIGGIVLAASRLGFAMARDGAFLRWFGAVHPRFATPARASWALCGASVFYVFAAEFRNLLNYFSFTVWIFYGLTAIALVLLRRRKVGEGTAYRAPGGLLAPGIVLLTAGAMTSGLAAEDPRGALYGLAMLGAGFAVYLAWRRLRARAA
jgi:amino acid transporter